MNSGFPYTITLTLVFAWCLFPGCGYPEVSPKTYEIAKALYSVSNLKRTEGIDKVQTLIAESQQNGELSADEAAYLMDIVQHCRDGEWETAQQECRQLMEDQIGVERESTPHEH